MSRLAHADHEARLEDVRWMIDADDDADLDEAAARLGLTSDALEVWLRRHHYIAELDALRERRRLSPAALHAQAAGRATAKSRRYREAS